MIEKLLSNLIITKIISATEIFGDSGTKGSNRDRPCWAIIIKFEGETVYTSGSRRFISDIDNIVLLPRGCNYDWHCTRPGHYVSLQFECASRYEYPIGFQCPGEELLAIFRRIEYAKLSNQPFHELESIRDTYSMLLTLAESTAKPYLPSEKSERIKPALEYILANYDKEIKSDELAALTGLSCVYFRKLFTSAYGVPPIVFAKRLRIRKAKEMLSADYASITEVATSLGYRTIFDFSRDFKKHTGMSPSEFAARR